MKEGQGVLELPCGSKYEGTVRDDQDNGIGKFTLADGDQCEGEGQGAGTSLGGFSGWVDAEPEERGSGAAIGAATSFFGGRAASGQSMLSRSLKNPSIEARDLLEGTHAESFLGSLYSSALNLLAGKEDEERAEEKRGKN